jgi:cyanophycinase
MITGEGDFTVIDGRKVEIAPGLGLLPGVVLDQHFVKRQRQNRLFGLVLDRPGLLGVGVDEATAILVRDETRADVVGRGQVLVVDGRAGGGRLRVDVLRDGQAFDLRRRRRLKN